MSESIDGQRLLLGEAKCAARPFDQSALERAAREIASRPVPALPRKYGGHEIVRAVCVPEVEAGVTCLQVDGDSLTVITVSDLIRSGENGGAGS